MSIVLDISRLMMRADHGTPTGIDRFELHYAGWVADRFSSDVRFVAAGPLGHRGIAAPPARALIASTAEKWNLGRHAGDRDLMLEQLAETIETGVINQSAADR